MDYLEWIEGYRVVKWFGEERGYRLTIAIRGRIPEVQDWAAYSLLIQTDRPGRWEFGHCAQDGIKEFQEVGERLFPEMGLKGFRWRI